MTQSLHRIQCANCRKQVFQYRGEFTTGSKIRSKDFFPMPGVPAPKPGEPMMCPFCKEPWYMVNARTGSIIVMTDKGWRPSAPTGPAPLTILQTARQRENKYAMEPETPPEFKDGKSEFVDPAARWRDEKKAAEAREKKEPSQ